MWCWEAVLILNHNHHFNSAAVTWLHRWNQQTWDFATELMSPLWLYMLLYFYLIYFFCNNISVSTSLIHHWGAERCLFSILFPLQAWMKNAGTCIVLKFVVFFWFTKQYFYLTSNKDCKMFHCCTVKNFIVTLFLLFSDFCACDHEDNLSPE